MLSRSVKYQLFKNKAGGLLPLLLLLLFSTCSGLKLDKDINCLNDKSGCFKADTTAPRLKQVIYPVEGSLVSVIDYVELMFTEELNNPKPSDFSFTGNANITINSVSKINDFTYRLNLTQNSLNSGLIQLNFPNLRDYNDNKISGQTVVDYTGNVGIPITLDSVSHPGMSSSSAYDTLTVTWHYNYVPPATPPSSTIYNVKVSTGTADCNNATDIVWVNKLGGTPVTTPAAGSAVTSGNSYTFTLDTALVTGSGAKTVLICVDNGVQNKHGVTPISIWRSDSAPTKSISPNGILAGSAKAITFTCNDPTARIIYSTSSTTDGVTNPAAPVPAPSFNPATGAVVNGTLYDPQNKPFTPYSASNPTWTVYSYNCMDDAGNITGVTTSQIFKIDSNYPSVTVANVYKSGTTAPVSGTSSVVSSYQNIDAIWSTNLVNQDWEIRSDGAACGSGGTRVAFGTSGVNGTPSPANSPFLKTIAHSAGTMSAAGDYTLTFCVYSNTTTLWGQDTFALVRDDTAPTIGVNVPAGSYGAAPNIIFTCTDHADKIAYDKTTAPLGSAPGSPNNPVFAAGGVVSVGTTFTTPITLDAQTVTSFKWKCIDKGGNESGISNATYTVDTVLPDVTLVNLQRTAVSNLAGAYPTTQITWTSSRAGLTYEIRNSGNCNGGPGGGGVAGNPGSATRYTGTVAAANTNITNTLSIAALDFPTVGNTYSYKICVFNAINNPGYQSAVLDIIRDETAPVFAGPAVITTIDPLNFSIAPTAATDANFAGYRIYRSLTSGVYAGYPATPDYTAVAIPFAIAMPDSQPYFLRIVAFDIAGNTTVIGSGEITTKPTITLTVTGLSGGNFDITDGASSLTVSANSTAAWNTQLGTGQTYNFRITSQPTGQVCSIQEKQFGSLSANITITVNCIAGQMVAGRFQQTKASNVSYMLYRGVSTALASSQTNPTSLIYAGGYVFYGNYADCDGSTAGNQYCLFKVPASSGSVATHVTGLTAPVRGVTTDGTNIYYSVTSPDNGVYKVPIAGGTPTLITNAITTPYGLAIEGNYLYVCSGGAMTIRRVDLSSGTITDIVGPLANYPLGIEIVGTELYFTTWGTHAIYRVPKSGGSATVVFGSSGTSGMQDGNGTGALLNQPHDLVYDGVDNLYFAEYGGNRMKKAKLSTGRVITLLGDGSAAFSLGSGPSAKMQNPVGITTDGKRIFLSNHNAGSSVMRIADQNNVGYWPLNGQVSDYSSDGFNGSFDMTQTGSHTLVLGRYGETNGAYRFDGGSTWFSTPHQNQFNLTSSYTISVWINTNSTSNQRIVDKATAGSANGYVLDIVSNRYRLVHGVSASTEILSNAAATTGSWVHLLATYSQIEKRARIYINGHLDAEQVFGISASTPTNTLALRLGSDSSNANVFSGAMAAVRLYGRVLSDAEINELAQDASAVQVGNSFNTGPTEAMVIYQFTGGTAGGANMAGSAPVSSSLIPSCSSPAGKDGDAAGSCYLDGNNNLAASSGSSAGTPWGSAPRTLCIWYNPPVFPNNDVLIAHGRGAAPNLQGFGISVLNANQIQFFNWGGPNVVFAYQTQLNTWQHVCGTLSGSTVEMFINGKSIGSDTGTIGTVNTVNDATSALTFGSSPDGNSALRFNGNIDDARIYNKVLTPAEIRQLATQIPAGLVARYDFDGDTSDVSGYGNNLTNSGATPSTDRFGAAAKAYHFNGLSNSMFNTSITLPFSTGNTNRTMCFWGRADQAIAGVRIGVAYGNSSINQASQIGFNSMDTNAPSTLGCAYGAPCSPTGYIHQNTWHHVCMVVNALNAQLYLNGGLLDTNGGSAGTTVSATAWNTQAGPIEVGSFSGNYRFPGDLDDVRIYNRALSTAEIQALVQQPNKKIYVTNSAYNGNLSGISGADTKCNSADANKPGGAGNFKAMLTDSGVSTLRRACTSSYCSGATTGIGEGIDWVLRPNITYLRALDGLPVFTANYNGIFDFSANNFTNAIHTTSFQVWTGINFSAGGEWTIDGGPGQCGSSGTNIGWMSSVGPYNGVYGNSSATAQTTTPAGVIYNGFETAACTGARRLYCVEQ